MESLLSTKKGLKFGVEDNTQQSATICQNPTGNAEQGRARTTYN